MLQSRREMQEHTPAHRVLFVTLGSPYPPENGAKIRDYSLVSHVAARRPTALLSLVASEEEAERLQSADLECERIEAILTPRRSAVRELSAAAAHVARGEPLATSSFYFDEVASRIRAAIAAHRADVVQFEHSFMASYARAVPGDSGVRTVLSLHNVGSRQYRTMLRMNVPPHERALFALKWLLMLGWEERHARRFDHVVVVSDEERRLLHATDSSLPVTVVENGVDTRTLTPLDPPSTANTMLFVGTFAYPPNVDAVVHFCESILPLVRRRIPDARLVAVGLDPPERVRRLARAGAVEIAGSVADVVPYYRDAAIAVVPLRAGGGTRLKILEAMALGRPVVSTSLGCEGLAAVDGEQIAVADTPHRFADAIVELLGDRGRRERMAREARRLVEERYDWRVAGDTLVALYDRLVARPEARQPAPEP